LVIKCELLQRQLMRRMLGGDDQKVVGCFHGTSLTVSPCSLERFQHLLDSSAVRMVRSRPTLASGARAARSGCAAVGHRPAPQRAFVAMTSLPRRAPRVMSA